MSPLLHSGQIQGRQQLMSPPLARPRHFMCHQWTYAFEVARSNLGGRHLNQDMAPQKENMLAQSRRPKLSSQSIARTLFKLLLKTWH